MHRKLSALFLAAMILTLAMAGTAFAQVNYGAGNNSTVPVTITVQVACPGSWSTSATLAPGATTLFSIPAYPCAVVSVIVNGNTYPVGYNGPANPPNPPNNVRVTIARTLVW